MRALILALALALPAWSAERSLIVVNDVSDPVSLDPHREFDASSENIAFQLYDGLLRFTEDGRIEPALAESWTRIDDKTLEFKLRPGVLFHNGEPFNAEAVRASLARQLDPKKPAPNAALLGKVSAVVVDELTVRLVTENPDGTLLNKLPIFLKILPKKYLREAGDEKFAAQPVGTGPFIFEKWVRGDRIELRGNPHYWMKNSPRLDRLIFKFLPVEEQLKALLDGRVDMITDLSGLDTLKVASHPGTRVLKAKNFYAVSLLFNTAKAPFSDAKARKAVAHAIDRAALIRYGAKGNAVALKSLTMDGQFGHNPEIPGYGFDPAKARELLSQAGLAKGIKIKMQVREELKSFGKIIAAQLGRLGIETEPYFVSQERQFQELAQPKVDGKSVWDGDLAIAHYVDPTVHSFFPYSIIVYSQSPYSLVSDKEADELFLKMTGAIDSQEQKSLAWELEERTWKECLSVSLIQILRPFGLRKNVRYQPYVTGMLDFRHASVENGHD